MRYWVTALFSGRRQPCLSWLQGIILVLVAVVNHILRSLLRSVVIVIVFVSKTAALARQNVTFVSYIGGEVIL